MIFSPDSPPPCTADADLFYSPEDDGRTEIGRAEREALAGLVCWDCPMRVACLERSLVQREPYGVWGGMGEGERRSFRTHLLDEGYDKNEIPTGRELLSSLHQFYLTAMTPEERLHGFADEIDLEGTDFEAEVATITTWLADYELAAA